MNMNTEYRVVFSTRPPSLPPLPFNAFTFSPPAFLWREGRPPSWLLPEPGQRSLCGLVGLTAEQSRRRNSILGSLNSIYFSSILSLELPTGKMSVLLKRNGGGFDVKVTQSFQKKQCPGSQSLGSSPNFAIHLPPCDQQLLTDTVKWLNEKQY